MSDSQIRLCPSCGAKNRIPNRHLADEGKCGTCKAAILPTGAPIEVDSSAFDAIVRDSRVPILVDFWAAWCGPCRQAAPEVEAVAREMAGRAIVLKVNTEAHPELAGRYHVQGIPNFLVFQGGQVAFQQAGLVPRTEMRRWLERAGATKSHA